MQNLLQKLKDFFSSPSYPRTLALIGLLIIVIALPVTVVVLQQRTNIFQHASGGCQLPTGICYDATKTCPSSYQPSADSTLNNSCNTNPNSNVDYRCCVPKPTIPPTVCTSHSYAGECQPGTYNLCTYVVFYQNKCNTNKYINCVSNSTQCGYIPSPPPPPPSPNVSACANQAVDGNNNHVSGAFCVSSTICAGEGDQQYENSSHQNPCGIGSGTICCAPKPTPLPVQRYVSTTVAVNGTYIDTSNQSTHRCGIQSYSTGLSSNTLSDVCKPLSGCKCTHTDNGFTCNNNVVATCSNSLGGAACIDNLVTSSHPNPCGVYSTSNPYPGDVCASQDGHIGVCRYGNNLPNCADDVPGTTGGSDNLKHCGPTLSNYKCCVYTLSAECVLTQQKTTGNVAPNIGKSYPDRCIGSTGQGGLEMGFCGYGGIGLGSNLTCNGIIMETHSINTNVSGGQGCAINVGLPEICCAFDACYNITSTGGGGGGTVTPPGGGGTVTPPGGGGTVTPPGGGGGGTVTPPGGGGSCTNAPTTFGLDLKLPGINTSDSGDSTKENTAPKHLTWNGFISIYDETTKTYPLKSEAQKYSTTAFGSHGLGHYHIQNVNNFAGNLTCGHSYVVGVKIPGYALKELPLKYGINQTLAATLIPGDANNDGKVSLEDYQYVQICQNKDPNATQTFTDANNHTITFTCGNTINFLDYQDGGSTSDHWSFNYNDWLRGYLQYNNIKP